jgi:hypothetical protein
MRFKPFLPVVLVIAVFGALVAYDSGIGVGGFAPVVSAQSETVPFGYDHLEIPFFGEWMSSGHADLLSEAWIHWNGDDPAVVPASCAKCHSSAGNLDFNGADGSAVGSIELEAHQPGVLQCTNCHNDETLAKTDVTMPSGIVLTDLGREAVCMECHQGRSSGATVAGAIERAAVDHDAVMEGQGFINIHYYAAAATRYGSDAGGGFEYPGKTYEGFFAHVQDFSTCQSCHDPHALELDVASCSTCHTGAETVADLRDIRMPGSFVDYDGDGDFTTGIATEIENLRDLLYDLMGAYSADVIGTRIGYESHTHPYFFIDGNGDGTIDAEEAVRANAFTTFTPRLLAAAYNYQVTLKDPGGYAHNAKYTIQLLVDSITDLADGIGSTAAASLVRPGDDAALASVPVGEVLANASLPPLDFAALSEVLADGHEVDLSVIELLHRDDAGHFDATTAAWRNWDGAGAVPATCSTCHSAAGLPFALKNGVQIAHEPAQGMACTTCHVAEDDFTLLEVEEVRFPSGAMLSFGTSGDNLCATCHQGRASTPTVNTRIGTIEDDTVSDRLGFVNIHYFSAAATRFGGEAMGGYQYDGKEYVGFWPHVEEAATCTQCHDPHNQQVNLNSCTDCHDGNGTIEDVRAFRMFDGDFDGNGDADEGTYHEIHSMIDQLYAAMQSYAVETVGTALVYSSAAHPYYFIDGNGNGMADPEEVDRANQYATWTPRLLRAAYNYQYAKKDPGSYVHNSQYVVQLLHDSLEDLGVDVSGMDRPDAPF